MRLTPLIQTVVALALWLSATCLPAAAQPTDSERLGMAIEYFRSNKYHEALIILRDLDSKYTLNPRFRAYLGVCCYYEWDYAQATHYLDSVIPQLSSFAPQELSFYCFADAESHFNLRQYDSALPLYTQMLTLCRDNEKPDAYYRMGFIYLAREEWVAALDHFQSALVYYRQYRPEEKARIAQIRNMINGCCKKINNGR